MSAQVIEFAAVAARRMGRKPAARPSSFAAPAPATLTHDFQFWTGSSGTRYVHTIHGLIDCPELPNCTFILVHRSEAGPREVLRIGRLEHEAPSLNLAALRQLGAQLGATEVHLHLLAESVHQRRYIELDLCAADHDVIADRVVNH